MTALQVRQAVGADVDDIAALWTEAADWLASMGTSQWQYPVRIHAIRDEVADGAVWIVRDAARLLASVTLEPDDDTGLWGSPAQHALYVHRLVVARDGRPADLGSALLDWAARRALDMGRPLLRLDAWTTNTDLHRYYLDRGFRHVSTDETVQSGALFERPSTVQHRHGPALVSAPSAPAV